VLAMIDLEQVIEVVSFKNLANIDVK